MAGRHHRTTPRTGLHLLGGNSFNIKQTNSLKPLQINGKPSKKYNMMTPRRLEAITPRTVRSFQQKRPSTCLPRIQTNITPKSAAGCIRHTSRRPETNKNESLNRLNSPTLEPTNQPEISVLERILCSGKTALLIPRKVAKVRMKPIITKSNKLNIGQRKRKPRVYKKPRSSGRNNNHNCNHNSNDSNNSTRNRENSNVTLIPSINRISQNYDYGNDLLYDEEIHEDYVNTNRATAVNAGLMSEEALIDIMSREITPEDFEMLLLLDETNDKKYMTVQQNLFDKFDRVLPPTDKAYECRVCLEPVNDPVDHEKLATCLPCCQRVFHQSCIKKWLREYSKTCPSCRKLLED
jgi:hypothetical protein